MHPLLHPVDTIEHNPEFGAKLTVFHLFAGLIIEVFKNGRIHPMIMDVFQLLAWVMAIAVGGFTILSYIRKWYKDSKESKKQDGNNVNHSDHGNSAGK